jgi:hypothetical protein
LDALKLLIEAGASINQVCITCVQLASYQQCVIHVIGQICKLYHMKTRHFTVLHEEGM